MNKKGFTLVELLSVIVIISILASVTTIIYANVIQKGKQGLYDNHENTLRGAAEAYLIENFDLIPNVGGSINISYQTLLNKHHIEPLKDPNGGNCDASSVLVTRNADVSNNYDLTYKVCLSCTNYQSSGCSNS